MSGCYREGRKCGDDDERKGKHSGKSSSFYLSPLLYELSSFLRPKYGSTHYTERCAAWTVLGLGARGVVPSAEGSRPLRIRSIAQRGGSRP